MRLLKRLNGLTKLALLPILGILLSLIFLSGCKEETASTTTVAPAYQITGPARAVVGSSKVFQVSGGKPPYSYVVSDNKSGSTISPSGIYKAGTTGGVVDTIRVYDANGLSATTTISVYDPLKLIGPPRNKSARVRQLVVSGGFGPFSYSFSQNKSGGALLSGGSLVNYTAGITSGVTDVIKVKDSDGNSYEAALMVYPDIHINGPANVALNNTKLFTVTGGYGTYTFSIPSNTSGGAQVASTIGGFNYTAGNIGNKIDIVKVTDEDGDSQTVSINVLPSLIIAGPTRLKAGRQGAYAASGGNSPYSFAIRINNTGGSITSNGLYTPGAITGVSDTLMVTDADGNTSFKDVLVYPEISISTDFPSRVMSGKTKTIKAQGGYGQYTFTIAQNNSGSTFTTSNNIMLLTGANIQASANDTVTVYDGDGNNASLSLLVYPSIKITPDKTTIGRGATQNLTAAGGYGTYVFSISVNNSGSTLGAQNGAVIPFTSGLNYGTQDTIQVLDDDYNLIQTTINVSDLAPKNVTLTSDKPLVRVDPNLNMTISPSQEIAVATDAVYTPSNNLLSDSARSITIATDVSPLSPTTISLDSADASSAYSATVSAGATLTNGLIPTCIVLTPFDALTCALNATFSLSSTQLIPGVLGIKASFVGSGPYDTTNSPTLKTDQYLLRQVTNFQPAINATITKPLLAGTDLYFGAAIDTSTGAIKLFKVSEPSTLKQVTNIAGNTGSDQISSASTYYNGLVYFVAKNGSGIGKLYAFDPSSSQLTRVSNLNGDNADDAIDYLMVFENRLVFSSTSGPSAGMFTYSQYEGLKKISSQPSTCQPVITNNVMYYCRSLGGSTTGIVGYKQDGTYNIQSIVSGTSVRLNLGTSSTNKLFFEALLTSYDSGGVRGYAYDAFGNIRMPFKFGSTQDSYVYGSFQEISPYVYFGAANSSGLTKLFRYREGFGVQQLGSINTGGNDDPKYITAYNGSVFLSARNASGLTKLFRYDSTNGFVQLSDISINDNDDPKDLLVANNRIYFSAMIAGKRQLFSLCDISLGCN